jgi:serine/threonine protein kinase
MNRGDEGRPALECGARQLISPTLFSAIENNDFQVLWEGSERFFCRGPRHANADNSAVLAVLPAAGHPTPVTLDRLAHEYGLKDQRDAAWAARPLELICEGGRTILVLEDTDGEPLDQLLGAPMETGSFLRLATSIAVALGKLHRCGLIHKDLKPINILANHTTGEVKFTEFGLASRLTRERQSPEPPETVAGTLASMAPEQTGRMNRSIDSRIDLYAFGVTLYEMLTASLPFNAADATEWIHYHIARNALSDRPGPRCAASDLRNRNEAARQSGGGPLPDCRWLRTRSSVLPVGLGDTAPGFLLGEHDIPSRSSAQHDFLLRPAQAPIFRCGQGRR